MDGPGLSDHEQRMLSEIESELRADRGLDFSLRTMRRRLGAPGETLLLGLLTVGTLVLLVAAGLSRGPVLIWVFAIVWTAVFVAAVPLLGRLWRRRRG
ncbi:DUF3040 domain-containing protein [Streptomyces sp. NPDC006879]|uniref:DUF3040 domain-containing protein n=1 Tax=Streptomyces sp. NPDC006879 TaxID=3364767 RepID=UPI0036849F82